MTEQVSAAATTTHAAADANATSGAPAPSDTSTTAPPAASSTSTQGTAVTGNASTTGDAPKDGATTDTAPAPKAPEKYEFSAPEGVSLDPDATAEFEQIAKGLDLSQKDAQGLVDLGSKLVQRIAQQQADAHALQVTKWLDESKADKEFGGERFDASVATARKAVEKFGTPSLKTLLDQTGLGNHPEVVRLFHRIGTAIAEDTFVNAPSGAGSRKSAASVLFDHPSSQTTR